MTRRGAILEEVQLRGADLVVMRTHGRSGLTRAVLGSVAEKIVKQSSTPVLLLPPGDRTEPRGSIDSILVPVDGTPGGALALSIATNLARERSASLQLLQVIQPLPPIKAAPFWRMLRWLSIRRGTRTPKQARKPTWTRWRADCRSGASLRRARR